MPARECVYCGHGGHRTWRCTHRRRTDWIASAIYLGWAAVVIALAASLASCTMAPDTLCQLPRPRAGLNDTDVTKAGQAKAAKVWDSQCTVRGWLTR